MRESEEREKVPQVMLHTPRDLSQLYYNVGVTRKSHIQKDLELSTFYQANIKKGKNKLA